jgi:hypothetical protein
LGSPRRSGKAICPPRATRRHVMRPRACASSRAAGAIDDLFV